MTASYRGVERRREPARRVRWRRALEFIRGHRGPLAVVFLLTLGVGAAGALEPLLLKLILDELAGPRRVSEVVYATAALGVLLLAREIISGLSNWLTWKTRIAVQYELLAAAVGRLHTLPLSFHQAMGVGATMTRLDRGVQGVIAGLSEIAFNLLPSVVYLCIAFGVMVRLDWRAALVVLLFTPVPALVGALAAPEQVRRERRLLERWTAIYARFNEVLAGIVTVKSFAKEDDEKRRFLHGTAEANEDVIRGVARDSWVAGFQNSAVALARVAGLALSIWLVLRGEMSVGTVVAFLGYMAGVFQPVRGLVSVYATVHRTSVALDTVLSILDAQDSLGDAPNARELAHVLGDVRFDHVSFAYNEHARVLEGIDLHVRSGEVLALVGPSGSGKSTMMALLQRLYDPTSGVVFIDGHDLREVKQRSLRANIGVVLQDALLFNDTVRDNITYGRPDATFDEVVAAARAANAEEFIERLPQRYETVVGERGGLLSAGQRQRLAIARAILKDPPILVLDEATSALDVDSEALVQQALAKLMRGRTVFIIAHRLSTVAEADRVVVLQRGRIVEMGTHAELLARQGIYAGMVGRQLGRGAPGRLEPS